MSITLAHAAIAQQHVGEKTIATLRRGFQKMAFKTRMNTHRRRTDKRGSSALSSGGSLMAACSLLDGMGGSDKVIIMFIAEFFWTAMREACQK